MRLLERWWSEKGIVMYRNIIVFLASAISQWETTNFFSKLAFTWAKIILHRHWRMVKTRKLPYSNKENFDPFLSNMVHTDLRPFFSSTFQRLNHIFSRTTFPLNLTVLNYTRNHHTKLKTVPCDVSRTKLCLAKLSKFSVRKTTLRWWSYISSRTFR